VILAKALTAGVIKKVLQILAEELDSVYLIEYEDLCLAPKEIFIEAADFLSLEMDSRALDFLRSTQEAEDQYRPYSIFRNTVEQRARPLRFVSELEAEEVRSVLRECGLS
jgi:hypothetical protein